jgi:hypothetical protein
MQRGTITQNREREKKKELTHAHLCDGKEKKLLYNNTSIT